jgi:hypothetical protein
MQSKWNQKLVMAAAVLFVVSAAVQAQNAKPVSRPLTEEQLREMNKGKFHPPSGASFSLSLATGNQFYTALLSDGGKFVQESYTHNQLPLLEAIVETAKAFGLTEENVGVVKPITTRFSDEQLPSFMIDVAKTGKQSRFYITMKNRSGILTVDAGAIRRDKPDDPEIKPLFLSILEQVKNAKAQQQQLPGAVDNPAQMQTRPPQ